MNWPVFLVSALVLMVIAGLTGGWHLPMAGIESPLARAICFAWPAGSSAGCSFA